MPVFAYRGLAPNGRNVSGVIDADSARNARGKLREQGIFPTELAAEEVASATAAAGEARDWLPRFRRRVAAPELALLTRQLSTLLGAGVQLVDALGTLSDQSDRPHVKRMLSQVRERVREGTSLAEALAAHPDIFSDLYVGMVRVGEAAGALEPVLDRLADYSERQSEFVRKVRGALTYPVIMILAGVAIMGFLVTYVIPQVATIFEQQHAALPLMTRVLIRLADVLSADWLMIVVLIIGLIAAIMFALSTKTGRRYYDRWILRAPYIGRTLTRIICARFARTLATLLKSGVQLMPALTAVKRVVTNGLLADAVEQSRDSIREGHGMGQTLQQSGLFPPLLIEMIKVGERSGELEQMLERVADNYEREVDASLGQLTTLLGPLMTILMGVVILIMMLSILQPILQLNQMMQ
jgi:general secretion pathway protein F